MSYPFDATLKEILSLRPEDCVPVFDLPRTALARTLNVDLSTISAATDVAFGFGSPLEEIVDLNFQSGPNQSLPARLHLYNAAFHFRGLLTNLWVVLSSVAGRGCVFLRDSRAIECG